MSVNIGIDLGTANVLIYIKNAGVVLYEPSVVAIDRDTEEILAIGKEAREMLGRTPENIIATRPLRDGVISDFSITEKMLRHFIKKVTRNKSVTKPRIAVCVPSGVTSVEKRAVEDATRKAGAREVFIIEEPLAAAIGAGLDINRPYGSMVIDIGGGTTDVAVISLGTTVINKSIKVAGDTFDEAIIKYMKKKFNLLIGERSAELLKVKIGSVFLSYETLSMPIRGRDMTTGLPVNVVVTSENMEEALRDSVAHIVEAVHSVLEKTPPELAADIYEQGIIITGGGALLDGIDKLIKQRTGINTYIAEDPLTCVAVGTGTFAELMNDPQLREDYRNKNQRM